MWCRLSHVLYCATSLSHSISKHVRLAERGYCCSFQGVYNIDQWLLTSEWVPCCWGRRLLLMICGRGWHVLFIHELVWSRSAAGEVLIHVCIMQRRTLMAPLPVAVQSGPFVWKWVYIHLLPNDSPSSPPCTYSSCTHANTHIDWVN